VMSFYSLLKTGVCSGARWSRRDVILVYGKLVSAPRLGGDTILIRGMGARRRMRLLLGLIIIMIVGSVLGQPYQACTDSTRCDYYACADSTDGGGNALGYIEMCGILRSGPYVGTLLCTNENVMDAIEGIWQIKRRMCPPMRCSAGKWRGGKPWLCEDCVPGTYMAVEEPAYDYWSTAPTPYPCQGCPAGKYQPLAGQTACLDCATLASGFYWSTPCSGSNLGAQMRCTVCEGLNELQSPCTATSNAVCRTFVCSIGQYVVAGQVNTCRGCERGTYQAVQGQASACTACAAGKYQDLEGQGACKDCAALQLGTYYQLTPCQGASAGTQARCSTCDVLYRSVSACTATENTKCGDFKCNPGSYKGGVLDICADCEPGKYQPAAGGLSCPACPAGKYQPGARATACLDCAALAAGSYWAVACQDARVGRQAACTKVCLPPLAGIYQNCSANADAVCGGFACDVGQYQPNAAVTACAACEAGKYNAGRGARACQPCGNYTYQPGAGATSCLACEAWLQGFYWPRACQGPSAGEQKPCTAVCPKGMWNVGACTRDTDTVCSTFIYCPGGQMTGQRGCEDCPPGSYRPSPPNASVMAPSRCTECEAGMYQPDAGKTGCYVCPLLAPDTYQATPCYGPNRGAPRYCSVCQAGKAEVRGCSTTEDRLCGATCAGNATDGASKYWWITGAQTCAQGEYLWGLGPPPGYDKICKPCPPDMIGLDGVVCKRCPGALEMPHWPDQASCVCRPPARMMQGGECACPPGWEAGGAMCVACGNNSYGRAGAGCAPCEAGTYSVGPAATACVACEAGKYRLAGEAGRCHGCAGGLGWMATDAATGGCARCNTSCGVGWREKGPCPGSEANELMFKVCEPCDALPANATWRGGEGCLYECDAGHYRKGVWECGRCSEEPCPPGRQWEACARDADRKCELECVNASKPMFNAKWAAGTGPGDCPWECEEGYTLARSDYWVFVIYECG